SASALIEDKAEAEAEAKAEEEEGQGRAALLGRIARELNDAGVILSAISLHRRNGRAVRPIEAEIPAGDEPRTPIEETVAEIYAEVLGRRAVGIHQDFFALGGDSLRATQAVARLRDAFHLPLPLRSLFEAPTVAGLATTILADLAQ